MIVDVAGQTRCTFQSAGRCSLLAGLVDLHLDLAGWFLNRHFVDLDTSYFWMWAFCDWKCVLGCVGSVFFDADLVGPQSRCCALVSPMIPLLRLRLFAELLYKPWFFVYISTNCGSILSMNRGRIGFINSVDAILNSCARSVLDNFKTVCTFISLYRDLSYIASELSTGRAGNDGQAAGNPAPDLPESASLSFAIALAGN